MIPRMIKSESNLVSREGIFMNKKIYAILLILLFALRASAMEEMIAYNQGLVVAEEKASETNIMAIHISMPRNASGTPCVEDFDLTQDDPIHLNSFKNLLQEKQDKKKEYILARAITQTDGGA